MLKQVIEVVPTHGVKSFGDVKLDKQRSCFVAMETPCNLADVKEVVVNATTLDESALSWED